MRPHMPPHVPDPDDERKREESYRKAPPANTRKPLPRHIVKQILAANSESMQAVPPWLQEMDDRAMAAIEARREARARRR